MVLGKKEKKLASLSGTTAETVGIEADILNYAKALASAHAVITGSYTVTLKIYGSTDIADSNMWKQIGDSVVITSTQIITPISIEAAYDALRITYSGAGTGSADLTLNLVRKRH